MVHLSTFARLSQRQIASLSLSLPPLASTPSASDAVIQPRGALTPGVLSQLGRPHALQAPCLTPIPRLRWFRLASGRLIRTPPTFSCQPSPANLLLPTFSCQPSPANLLLPTFSCQPSPANLPLPQAPSFTACARARTRRFSSSSGSAASARSSAIREWSCAASVKLVSPTRLNASRDFCSGS